MWKLTKSNYTDQNANYPINRSDIDINVADAIDKV